MKRVLSICTGMGLLDLGFAREGFDVVGGCEIHEPARGLYRQVMGHELLHHDLEDLVLQAEAGELEPFDGIIGGPPCQSHSKLRARWDPKFPDLTPLVERLVQAVKPSWFVFENVVALDLTVPTRTSLVDAMHMAAPHQSRPRWFTHTPNIDPPAKRYEGDTLSLLAYPGVYGKLYGAPRAAVLQGYPEATKLEGGSAAIVMGLANAVHLEVARAWAQAVDASLTNPTTLFTEGATA